MRMDAYFDMLAGVQQVAAGYYHSCALMTTGGVRCWGYNNLGQLGTGGTTNKGTPGSSNVLTGVAGK